MLQLKKGSFRWFNMLMLWWKFWYVICSSLEKTHYKNELQCIAFRYWSNHESSAKRKKSNYMDDFENIYVIFSMNSDFVDKGH